MHFDQRAANGKTQTGAAGLAGGRVIHLGEGLEEFGLIFFGNAGAGIGDGDHYFGLVVGLVMSLASTVMVPSSVNLAALEMKLMQYLADAGGIGANGGQVGWDDVDQFDRVVFDQANRS